MEGHWTIEVLPAAEAGDPRGRAVEGELRALGFRVPPVRAAEVYWILPPQASRWERADLERAAAAVFADPVTQTWRIAGPGEPEGAGLEHGHRATVMKRAGVMDPVEASAVK